MPQRNQLPVSLGTVFATSTAMATGVAPGRLRARDLTHPFRGANAIGGAHSLRERAEACAVRMSGPWVFCSVTAAVLHGIPLPLGFDADYRPLDVAVVAPRTPPRAEGIIGHKYAAGSFGVVDLAGLPVSEAPAVWCQLAAVLSREDLVAAGDFLLSGDSWAGRHRRPLCTRARLEAAVAKHSGKRGARNLRWALARIRPAVDSRPESLLRLLLVAAGLPEPSINPPIPVAGGAIVLHPDLALPQWMVIFEYQGEGHRDKDRFLGDIDRHELFRAAGWEVIQVTSKDLFLDRPAFLARVFAVMRRRGFRVR